MPDTPDALQAAAAERSTAWLMGTLEEALEIYDRDQFQSGVHLGQLASTLSAYDARLHLAIALSHLLALVAVERDRDADSRQ